MSDKRRKIVQVDEAKLKRMIAGEDKEGMVVSTKEVISGQQVSSFNNENVSQEPTGKAVSVAAKSKKHKTGYMEEFLRINRPALRRPTTIQLSEGIYRKIGKLLLFSPGLSIAMFINNVLEFHFKVNTDDIEEVIENGIRKLKENE